MNTIRDVFAAPLRHALHTLHILYVAWNRRQNEQRRSLRESQKLWGEKRFLLSGIRESLVRGSSHDTSDSSDFPVGVGGGEVSGGTPPSDFLSLEDRGVSLEGKHQGGEKEEERERTRKRKAEEAHGSHHDLVVHHPSTLSPPVEVDEDMGDESSGAPLKYEEFQNDAINSQHQHLLFRYDLAQWIEWRGRKARNAARRAGGRGGRPKRRGRGEDDRAGKTSGGRGQNRQDDNNDDDDEALEASREDEENDDDDDDEDVEITTLGGIARRFFGERRARRNQEEEQEDNEDVRHNNDMEGEVESREGEDKSSNKDKSSSTSSNTTDERRRRNGRERTTNGQGSTESEKGKEGENNSSHPTSLVFHHDILPNRSQYKEETDFALLQHPFVLDAAIKAVALKQHAAIEQFQQARQVELDALFSLLSGQGASDRNPFLDITVRRDHIVQDTLYEVCP